MQDFLDPSYNMMKQYIVKPNDTLYLIAKANNVTVDDLKKVNHLYSNMIYPNQILFIPNGSGYNNTYVTQPGDCISSILSRGNITLDDLLFYNNIENLTLEGNQLLLLDKKKNEGKYKIDSTDTIDSILQKFNLSPIELLKLNEKLILGLNEITVK